MFEKIQLLRLRFLTWYATLSKGRRISFISSVSLVGSLLLAFIGYGAYSYYRWNFGDPNWSRDWAKLFPSTKDVSVAPTAARNWPSPINGNLYTEEEAEIFMARRPLAVMVNNHVDARPQFGLSEADIIYEAVAEGGITRFLAVLHSQDCDQVGPVRSARIYYIDWAAELNAWYAHWGGAFVDKNDPKIVDPESAEKYICDPAADAYAYINRYGVPSLDQMWLGETAYWRDYSRNVAMEHTGYTSTQKLWHEAPNRYPEAGWREYRDIDHWRFKSDSEEFDRPGSGSLSFSFWDIYADFDVRWEYDPATNTYLRYQGGVKQIDAGNEREIRAKNVIVQFTKQSFFGDKKAHLKYTTIDEGLAKVFLDGKVIDAIWRKTSVFGRTKYFRADTEEEIKFNRGQIWVEILPKGNQVEIG